MVLMVFGVTGMQRVIWAVGMLDLAALVVMAMMVMPVLAVRVLVAVVSLAVVNILRGIGVHWGCRGSGTRRIASRHQ